MWTCNWCDKPSDVDRPSFGGKRHYHVSCYKENMNARPKGYAEKDNKFYSRAYKAAHSLGLGKYTLSDDHFRLTKKRFISLGGSKKEWERVEAKARSGTTKDTELETQETANYWTKYAAVKQSAAYKAEQQAKKRDNVAPLRGEDYDPKKHNSADPSDPDAYVPSWVRFAKRELVFFTCPITGWKESDWIQPSSGGKTRLVGELTLDHKLARSKNGRTTDENTRMICGLANGKKGNRDKTDEQIRTNLLANYRVVEVPEDLLVVLNKYGVREYR